MQGRAKALASPLHPAHFSALVLRPLLMEVMLGGQHRARHVEDGGTELTLPLAGTGRGLKAGTHGIATTWPPPLPCTSLHTELKLCA